jgi:hypothetical protein
VIEAKELGLGQIPQVCGKISGGAGVVIAGDHGEVTILAVKARRATHEIWGEPGPAA